MSWPCFLGWAYLVLQPPSGSDPAAYRGELFFGFSWVFVMVMWCREDAILVGRPLPKMALWVAVLFWPIALPALVLRRYGFLWGASLLTLHLILYFMLLFIFLVWMMSEHTGA